MSEVFESFAQNFEDVMLWRVFNTLTSGTYIDVGAGDPTVDSVTKAFYDRGWSGINIDPLKNNIMSLNKERLLDTNLEVVIGGFTGEVDFYEIGVAGWSTASKSVAQTYMSAGIAVSRSTKQQFTLTDIWKKHLESHEVNFLKIDVEGTELQVLEGLDLEKYRPWLILIESTHPNTQVESHEAWEHILTCSQYIFVYKDGLNRFYLASEHESLRKYFEFPPNVFDNFVKNRPEYQVYLERISELQSQIAEILNSKSWRVIRLVNKILKKIRII